MVLCRCFTLSNLSKIHLNLNYSLCISLSLHRCSLIFFRLSFIVFRSFPVPVVLLFYDSIICLFSGGFFLFVEIMPKNLISFSMKHIVSTRRIVERAMKKRGHGGPSVVNVAESTCLIPRYCQYLWEDRF